MYQTKLHIHFAGIGGIGMSGIATILKQQGYTISGCDMDHNQQSIKNLKALGCEIYEGNNTPACKNHAIDMLVYSTAIKKDNSEITDAQARGIPTIHRSVMLGKLMQSKLSIAVTGSHGKTTTTSLIAHILMQADTDPTIVIGGHLPTLASNACAGKGDLLIAEADESDRSFLNLFPTMAVITNIDLEHLETYQDIDDIKATFKQFLDLLPPHGKAIMCLDDEHTRALITENNLPAITYGFTPQATVYATDIELHPKHSVFKAWACGHLLGTVTTALPGNHNVLNSLAALAVALELNIDLPTIANALATFPGVERRFSFRGHYQGAEIFDDYGHHPREIYNTLLVARKRTKQKLVVVFQPHRYTRTHKLWDEFVQTFIDSGIDHLIITDVYAAFEEPIPGVTSQELVHAIAQRNPPFTITYLPYEHTFTTIIDKLTTTVATDDLVLLLGAGKVNMLTHYLPK